MFAIFAVIFFVAFALAAYAVTSSIREREEAKETLKVRLDSQTGVGIEDKERPNLLKDLRLSSIGVMNTFLGRLKFVNKLALMMRQAGLKAFEERLEEKSGIYAYEQRDAAQLSAEYEQQFRANRQAWDFFQSQAGSYRKAAIWWVVSAKKEETRLKRLATLIEDSAQGRTIASMTRWPRPE